MDPYSQQNQYYNQLQQQAGRAWQFQNGDTGGPGIPQKCYDPLTDSHRVVVTPNSLGIKKEQKKMGFVKEYFTKHRELFMGLAMALILDRYLLGGAFQERLKKIITGLLDKTENALAVDHKPQA